MRSDILTRLLLGLVALAFAAAAHAAPLSYSAEIHASKGNPVTDVLILESDGARVYATIHGSDLTGNGLAVVSHDPPFTPTQALVIGLTDGQDEEGNDKVQIIMFLDRDFATTHAGIPFSSVFPGARHSLTIASLEAAVAGDPGELAWFTNTFFSGPAAGAAFAPGGPFAVAEFTSLDIIGGNAVAGNWMLMGFTALSEGHPDAQSNRETAVLDETAKFDLGPFDIALTADADGQFAIDKTVQNDTGTTWTSFAMELGTDSGPNFVRSTPGDGLGFVSGLNNREETGAFPGVHVEEDRIVFTGFLPPGGQARFIAFVTTDQGGVHVVTVRQRAMTSTAAPAMHPPAIVLLLVVLCGLAVIKLRRAAS